MSRSDMLIGAVAIFTMAVTLGLWGRHFDTSHPLFAAYQSEVGSVTLEQAGALYAEGAVFVDARSSAEFRQGHVRGAISLPAEPSPETLARLQLASRVVIYCSGPDCGQARQLGLLLRRLGLEQTVVMEAGFGAWQEAGLPTLGEGPAASPKQAE
ncbi:MAG: rhodanese-like domain-containing protein [Vulcanimicrobiota bacterium]